MSEASALERLLKRDRTMTLAGLAASCALAWLYILTGAGLGMSAWEMTTLSLFPHREAADMIPDMPGMDVGGAPMAPAPWAFATWALMIAMWWIMMIAMMAPSAAPTILLYAHVNRHALAQRRDKFAPTGAFAAGYLLVWLGFSVAAAALHWALERAGLISAMLMGSQSRWLAQKVRFVFPEAPLSLAGQGYGGGRAWWPLDVQRLAVRWTMLGIETPTPLFIDPRIDEAEPLLRPPTEGQAIVADYGSLGLTLRRHPLALLRPRFDRLGFETAAGVQRLAHGDSVHTAGLVIMRQRPGTATGVVFVTLEDETGYVNLIVWSSLVEQQRKALLGSRLLGVIGEVQREGRVVHVLTRTLEDHTRLLGRLATQSRDFH